MNRNLCSGQGAEPVAHVLCEEDHSGVHADGLNDPAWLGRPHCAACGDILPEPAPILAGVLEVLVVETLEVSAPEPIMEAIGIVLRLANALDGMTVAELEEVYGEDLAEIMADAQAWATRE